MGDMEINTAVVDDGISEKLYNTGDMKYNIEILADLTIRERKNYDAYAQSHATTCAAIIRKYAEGAPVSSIKILDNERKTGRKGQLIAAISWCTENNIRLINLSLGTIDFRDFQDIKKCINHAAGKGIIIVAACNNRNVFTYPACLSNVIGVRSRKIYFDDQFSINLNPLDGIDILASGRHRLTDTFHKELCTGAANSFAAPMISAKVYNILKRKGFISLEEIKRELHKEASSFLGEAYNPYMKLNTDWVGSAIIINVGLKNDKYPDLYSRVFKVLKIINIDTAECTDAILDAVRREAGFFKSADAVVVNAPEGDYGFEPALLECCKSLGVNVVVIQNSGSVTSTDRNAEVDGIRVWRPFHYINAVHKSAGKESGPDIPVVAVYGEEGHVLSDMLYKLNLMFRKDGYYSVPVSNICGDILMEAEYLPDGVEVGGYLSDVYKKYCCDLILMSLKYDAGSQQHIAGIRSSIDIDVELYIAGKEGLHISGAEGMSENHLVCEYSGELKENEVIEAYDKIIKLFNADNP